MKRTGKPFDPATDKPETVDELNEVVQYQKQEMRGLRDALQQKREYWAGYADAEAELLGQSHKGALYAAAPKMLAALKWAATVIRPGSDLHNDMVAAIAEAEGK